MKTSLAPRELAITQGTAAFAPFAEHAGLRRVWHFTHGPSTLEMLSEVPLDRVTGLQINDVRAEP